MKRIAFIVALLVGTAFAQSTTITGTIKDLTQANVTSGKVTFTLTPSRDTTISGLARFSPQTVTCVINGSGLIKALDGVSTCTITQNTALQPPGSYYVVGVWPNNVKTSTFTFYAVLSSYDWSTVVPTPTTSPAQNFVDIFSNQTIGGNKIWSGTQTFNGLVGFPGGLTGSLGPVTLSAINSAVQFVNSLTAGSDASCKIQTAIGSLPTAGGIIFAEDLQDVAGVGACTIDPGAKSVTIFLGPYQYNLSQIILRTGLHIYGAGTGAGLAGSKPPTLLQSVGSNATPLIALSQTVNEGQEDVILRGFRLKGASGNTSQSGIQVIAPQGGGLWFSEFDDLELENFKGVSLDLQAPTTGAPNGINQFSTFKRIVAFRPNSGTNALHIKGFNNSLKFENVEFDGSTLSAGGDGGTNIKIEDDTAITFPPYNIKFDLLTCQWAGVCMQVNGANSVSIDQGHFEGISGVLQTGAGASFGSLNITMHDSGFFNGTGINGGNGFIVNQTAAAVNASIQVIDSHAIAAPDNFFKGNTDAIYQCGNTQGPEGSYTYLPCSMRSSNTIALSTGSIGAHACTAAQTAAVPGVKTSSVLTWNFTTTPVGVTGYGDGTTPFLVVTVFPTANTVNAVVCNTSAGSITPGAITIRVAAWNTVP